MVVGVCKQNSFHFCKRSVVAEHVSVVGFHTNSWIYQRHNIDVSFDVTIQSALRSANSQILNGLTTLMLINGFWPSQAMQKRFIGHQN